MGLLDLIVSKEQRMLNQKKRIEQENRELQVEIETRKAQKRQEKLRKELNDLDAPEHPDIS